MRDTEQYQKLALDLQIALATLCNSLGRFYYLSNLLDIAADYYQQAKLILTPVIEDKNYQQDLTASDPNQREIAINLLRLYGTEILHNTGNLGLRLWEVSSESNQSNLVSDLEKSFNYQTMLPNKTPVEIHSLYYTQRSLARAYKKQALACPEPKQQHEQLIKAQKLFIELSLAKVYIDKLEARGLAEMDLGGIAKLIADNAEVQQRDYQKAIAHLKKSATLLEQAAIHPSYRNKDKDLAVTLVRLAEAYYADHQYDQAEQSLYDGLAAEYHYCAPHQPNSLTFARLYYRLAQVHQAQGYSALALADGNEALKQQILLYGPAHPYTQASQILCQTLKTQVQKVWIGDLKDNVKAFIIDCRHQLKQFPRNEYLTKALNEALCQRAQQKKQRQDLEQQQGYIDISSLDTISPSMQFTWWFLYYMKSRFQAYFTSTQLETEVGSTINQLAQDFGSQIQVLDNSGIHDLAYYAVERLCKYHIVGKMNTKLSLDNQIRQGVLQGKLKKDPLISTQQPLIHKLWTVAGIFERSGIQTKDCYYRRRGKQDESAKYGFRQGTVNEIWTSCYDYQAVVATEIGSIANRPSVTEREMSRHLLNG